MPRIHLYGHMDRNYVKVGDRVVAWATKLGTMGNGNSSTSSNNMYAHLHYSISEGLTTEELRAYVHGWTLDKVKKNYRDPRGVDFNRMFGTKVDVGNRGYGWLQPIQGGKGYHPGVDVNGLGGGNTDMGMPFLSPISGTVVHEWRGWTANGGWGNLIMVEEDECTHCCPLHCQKA
jgi:murein DD-endopeptidase MepM/ murein hydrolase activator NlpD